MKLSVALTLAIVLLTITAGCAAPTHTAAPRMRNVLYFEDAPAYALIRGLCEDEGLVCTEYALLDTRRMKYMLLQGCTASGADTRKLICPEDAVDRLEKQVLGSLKDATPVERRNVLAMRTMMLAQTPRTDPKWLLLYSSIMAIIDS